MSNGPTFVIAGDPNAGKSTLVACLAENDQVRIDRKAGTTRVAKPYDAMVGGKSVLTLIDLPGFENPAYLKQWFDEHTDEPKKLVNRFVDEHRDQPRFKAECEILRSLDGAAVIFVCDASRRCEQKDRDQAEILRLCTDKRLAVINLKSDVQGSTLADWKEMLGNQFTYHLFNPSRADFKDRIELLEKISHVIPGWRESMKNTITIFERDWNELRIPTAADRLCDLIESTIKLRRTVFIGSDDGCKVKAASRVKQELQNAINEESDKFRLYIRQVFGHTKADWNLPGLDLNEKDIFSEEVWKKFGLTKKQLVGVCTAIGAGFGGLIDFFLGGASFLLGTMVGGVIGGSIGLYAASRNSAIKVRLIRNSLFQKLIGGLTLVPEAKHCFEARASPFSNLPFIILDLSLPFIRAAARWSHGCPTVPDQGCREEPKLGMSSRWKSEDQMAVARWVGALASGKPRDIQKHEGKARLFLAEQVRLVISERDLTEADSPC
jgi:GTP-binding protein EngB required for normal cell division